MTRRNAGTKDEVSLAILSFDQLEMKFDKTDVGLTILILSFITQGVVIFWRLFVTNGYKWSIPCVICSVGLVITSWGFGILRLRQENDSVEGIFSLLTFIFFPIKILSFVLFYLTWELNDYNFYKQPKSLKTENNT
jgi:hypothetical protein